jgi:hypothetical protein
MGTRTLAVLLLLGAAAAQAAPAPVAPAGAGDDIISDRGEGFGRSTSTQLTPTTPGEAERADDAAARDLGPSAPLQTPPPAAPEAVGGPEEERELTDALEAPGSGRIIEGRGGHDHVERRGRGLILDGEGRRLEILPVKNRLVETPPLPKAPDELDAVLARLRALTAAGAAFTLLLTAWLWRRKDA